MLNQPMLDKLQTMKLRGILHRRAAKLFRELSVAHADGSFGRLLLRFSRIDILVLDDFAWPTERQRAARFPGTL